MPYTICGKNKGRIKTVAGRFDAVLSCLDFHFSHQLFV